MSGALLGAASCLRCGSLQRDGQSCAQCRTVWAAAAEAGVLHGGVGPLSGVVRAAISRRYLAHLVDLAAVAAAVGLVLAFVPAGSDARRWPVVILGGSVALVVLVLQGRGC